MNLKLYTKNIFLLALLCFVIAKPSQALDLNKLTAELKAIVLSAEGEVGLVFVDLNSSAEVAVNGNKVFPTASVGKLAVMATAYHLAESGKINLEQKIKLKQSDKLGGSGVLQWLKSGRYYTLRNLIRMMIVLSDNTATKMVVEQIGLAEISSYLKAIGLNNTIIADPTMLKELPNPNVNLTTPEDMARLVIKLKRAEGFSERSSAQMLSYMHNQRYRWGIWRGITPGVTVADKTGNLEGVLNDVGIVYTKSGNYALAIFTKGFKRQSKARLVINAISQAICEEYTGDKVVVKKKVAAKKKYCKKRSKKKITKRLKAKSLRRKTR